MISAVAIGYSISAICIAYLFRVYCSCHSVAVCRFWSTITPCLVAFLLLATTRSFFSSSKLFEAAEIVLFNICIVLVTAYFYVPIGLFESINPGWTPARFKFYLRIYAGSTLVAVIAKLIFLFGFGTAEFVLAY